MRGRIARWIACLGALSLVALSTRAAEPAQASSPDGRWQLRAEGHALVVLDRGERVKTIDASRRDGQQRSTVAEIHAVPQRRSFVIAFDTLAELWELSIDPNAEPVFDGLVHDWRLGEAIAEPGFLGVRRTRLEQPLRTLAFDDSGAFVLGRASAAADAGVPLHLVQLDIRRTIARLVLAGDPDLAAARALRRDGLSLIGVPDRQGGAATLIDVRGARVLSTPR